MSGQGTKVYIGTGNAQSVDAAADTFIEIGEINDVTPPSPRVGTIDVTHHASTIMEFIAALPDGGEGTLSLNCIFNDAGQVETREALMARQLRNFRIDFPTLQTPNRLDVKAIVTGMPMRSPTNDKISLEITFKASSLYSWSNQ